MPAAEKLVDQPIFVLSLDLEFIWGTIHTREDVAPLVNDKESCRGAIGTLLRFFEKYDIPATWAVVGHLFLSHCEKDEGIPHKNMPRFRSDWYSCDPCTDIDRDPLFYGRDMVENIVSNPIRHEVAYHSFSHVIFSECDRDVAEAEIRQGIELAKEFGIKFKSFVFPLNKVGHVDILKKYEFRIYRGKTLHRGLWDRVVPPPIEPKWMNGIWKLQASGKFPPNPFPSFTPFLRIKAGIKKTIKTNGVFHVFLHPEDIVRDPSLTRMVDKLLSFISQRRNEGKLQVATMGQLVDLLDERLEMSNRFSA